MTACLHNITILSSILKSSKEFLFTSFIDGIVENLAEGPISNSRATATAGASLRDKERK